MKIKINGKDEEIGGRSNISELVSGKGLVADRIVVEHNFRIVPKEEWQKIILNESDNVEIVSFVGGG
ncbi:MAG: sulfur carrier protein ThiS [Candidatus Omnitrophota bacterium]